MKFAEPGFFFLAIPWVMTLLLFSWSKRERLRRLSRISHPSLIPSLVRHTVSTKRSTKNTWMLTGIAFSIIAMAEPRFGYEWKEMKQVGVDIMVVLDVSNSMLSRDIEPNRLERAKRKITDLFNMLNGDRVGLVAFAGTSFLQCPLTLDYRAAKLFLRTLDTDLIPVQGTAIGHALITAIRGFSDVEKKSRTILLITDGEDHEGKVMEAIKLAKEEEVKVFIIGIGTDPGSPLPDKSHRRGFMKNAEGNVIVSKINDSLLKQIAMETGGTFVRSVTGDMDLDTIYSNEIKQKIQKKELKSANRKVWTERFQWWLALALFCILVSSSIREKTT